MLAARPPPVEPVPDSRLFPADQTPSAIRARAAESVEVRKGEVKRMRHFIHCLRKENRQLKRSLRDYDTLDREQRQHMLERYGGSIYRFLETNEAMTLDAQRTVDLVVDNEGELLPPRGRSISAPREPLRTGVVASTVAPGPQRTPLKTPQQTPQRTPQKTPQKLDSGLHVAEFLQSGTAPVGAIPLGTTTFESDDRRLQSSLARAANSRTNSGSSQSTLATPKQQLHAAGVAAGVRSGARSRSPGARSPTLTAARGGPPTTKQLVEEETQLMGPRISTLQNSFSGAGHQVRYY